jgi:hypothetical protein
VLDGEPSRQIHLLTVDAPGILACDEPRPVLDGPGDAGSGVAILPLEGPVCPWSASTTGWQREVPPSDGVVLLPRLFGGPRGWWPPTAALVSSCRT